MPAEGGLRLRRATLDAVPVLEAWDTDPDVIAATTDDLRAIDIWIGAATDRNKGCGPEMMRLAHPVAGR